MSESPTSDPEPHHVEGKQTQRALEASEARYRRLFEAARDGILILDAKTGEIVDVNPFLTELTGYSHEDFVGQHLWEIGPFRDVAASRTAFAELQAKEYVRYEHLPLQTRDGRTVPVEFVSNVYRVDTHDVIQCNIRDISERRQAERELQFRNLILSTQQEASLDGILVVDVAGKMVSSNRRFAEMWGIPPDVIESASDERSLQSVMSKLEAPDEFMSKVRALYASPDESSRDEIALRDGRTFDRYSAPMLGPDRSPFGRVWYFRDITERRQAEAKRASLEAQLQASQKMEAVGRLAGGIAHDFNNLLSVILSYTSLALDTLREGDPLRDDLKEVVRAGESAAVLIRQLLAVGRRQLLQPAPLSLNQIAAGLERMLRRVLGEDIDLRLRLAPDLGLTLADRGQIEQVLMNLVVNARDAMPEGGKLTIETSNVELDAAYAAQHAEVSAGPHVMLAVSDSGCGMDERTQARLFEPFFTTKDKGKGTGLGLSIVYGIVKQSGGSVWVYSELGEGTTFKIYLPRELTVTTATAVKPSTVPSGRTGSETILVVEDEQPLREVARRILEAAGYTVLTAEDGDQALLTSARHVGEIHLLLTDMVMPRMSGRRLAQKLLETRPTLRVLYMSGYADDAIAHHGVLDAGTHFLGKPFTAADMTTKVRDVLDGGITR